jgi:DNA-binding NarL/FixJ family response regulator
VAGPIAHGEELVMLIGMRNTIEADIPRARQGQCEIRITVVDDHPAVRAGLGFMLAAEPGIKLLGTAATAAEAYEQVEREVPDLAVLDYQLPGEDGLSLCFRLKSLRDAPRVLMLSAFADEALVVMAVVAGADGVVDKGAPTDLCEAVAALVSGETLFPKVSPNVMAASGSKLDHDDLPILGMLIHGVPSEEIAETLGVEPAWLAVRRWTILERLRDRPPRRATAGPDSRRPAAGA